MFKPTFTITDTEVMELTREMGYEEAIKGMHHMAPLFWEGDFQNDCYKILYFGDKEILERIDETAKELDRCRFDEDEYAGALAREYIVKALNKYCKENHITTDHVLVDVSW